MKRTFIIVLAALMCLSFASCKKKEKKITIEAQTGEPGYQIELKDTMIIAPDGSVVEEFKPISDDAIVKSIDEITGLNDIVAVFESCYNGVYTAEYDTKSPLASNEEYFLVTNYNSVSELRTELLKTFADESLLNIVWKYDGFIEEGGKLYYKPIAGDTVTFKAEESTINYSNDEACELSVPMYNKHNISTGVYNIEFTKVENTFVISYLTE